jgi:hypothetical protein
MAEQREVAGNPFLPFHLGLKYFLSHAILFSRILK